MSVTGHFMCRGSMKQKTTLCQRSSQEFLGNETKTLKTETNANHVEIQFVPYRQHSCLRTSRVGK